jgi:hypothetical protein
MENSKFEILNSKLNFQNSKFNFQCLEFVIWNLGFHLGFRVWNFYNTLEHYDILYSTKKR